MSRQCTRTIFMQLGAQIKPLSLKVNCSLLKLNRKLRKIFLNPRRESNPQLSDLWWDALTIGLPGLRWQREGYGVYWFVRATYVLLIQQSRYMSIYLINKGKLFATNSSPLTNQAASNSIYTRCHYGPVYMIPVYLDVPVAQDVFHPWFIWSRYTRITGMCLFR